MSTVKTERTVVEDHALRRSTTEPLPPRDTYAALRSERFVMRRRRWPGVMAAAIVGGVIAALAVSSYYDDRTLGQRLDATVNAANEHVQRGVASIEGGASEVAANTARLGERAVGGVGDVGITAAVKASLATDPALSALKIDVTTRDGVVTLEGPAPDEKARERAGVLAAAPRGVVSVDNRLVVGGQPASG